MNKTAAKTYLPIIKSDGAFVRKTALVLTVWRLGAHNHLGVGVVLARKAPTEMKLATRMEASWTVETQLEFCFLCVLMEAKNRL